MGILGGISGKQVIRKLNRIGYEVVRHEGIEVFFNPIDNPSDFRYNPAIP